MLELFLTFFKIGLFTFGGGYAMIAVVEDACVEAARSRLRPILMTTLTTVLGLLL